MFHWQFLITCIFFVSLKFAAHCITGQWGDFKVINATLCSHILFGFFCCCYCCISSKKNYFYHFYFFFWWSIKFPQQNINQSETGIGHEKWPVELTACSQLYSMESGYALSEYNAAFESRMNYVYTVRGKNITTANHFSIHQITRNMGGRGLIPYLLYSWNNALKTMHFTQYNNSFISEIKYD